MSLSVLSVVGIFASIFVFADVSWGTVLSEKQPMASISIGGEFSTGDYNTGSTTRSIYLPLIASWYPTDRIDMSVELPLLYQSSSQITTTIYQAAPSQSATQSTARRGGAGGPAGASGTTGAVGTAGASGIDGAGNSAVSGIGDITLRAGYIPCFENNSLPQIRTSLFVKSPTASVSNGLGTGEFDFGGGLDLSKWFGSMHLAGETLYTFQGKVPDFGLKNYFSYNGTVGYQITQGIQPMLVIKGATAPSIYSDSLLEVRGRMLLTLASSTAIDLFVSRGISKSSAEYGGGIAIINSF